MKFNIILFFLLLSFVSQAQTKDTIYLWLGDVPGEKNPKHQHISGQNKNDNGIIYTDITNPTYVVYKPEASKNNGYGIIVCSGGGYGKIGTMDDVAAWLNNIGFTAFSLQYRVPQKRDGAFMDIQRAIRIIRSKSGEYKINPNKLGIMGLSAGGHLCTRAATGFNIDSYSKIDAIDTISSRPDFALLLYPAYIDKGANRSLSPELIVSKRTPPMFICVAENDVNHGNSSLVLTKALRDANVPVELHMIAEGGHGFKFQKGNPAAEVWPIYAESWLRQVIKKL